MNRIRLNWALSELEVKTADKAYKAIATDLMERQIGVIRKLKGVSLEDRDLDYGNHHIGTVRMGDSPDTGVVDKNCKVFGLQNLYVAGCGVFPTSGVTNPTLSLTALSLRLADHLIN